MTARKFRSYSSHLPVLMDSVRATRGPVLEMGTGLFSTPVLHWLCWPTKRPLVSYEQDTAYAASAEQWRDDWHDIRVVKHWDEADIERPWDVALIDHGPGERRRIDIARLVPWAQLIVVHDTCARDERWYQYREVFTQFRYQASTDVRPRTTVLSNAIDVSSWAWH